MIKILEINICDVCSKEIKKNKHGCKITIGYSLNGWGRRKDIAVCDVICDECFKKLLPAFVYIENVLKKRQNQSILSEYFDTCIGYLKNDLFDKFDSLKNEIKILKDNLPTKKHAIGEQ